MICLERNGVGLKYRSVLLPTLILTILIWAALMAPATFASAQSPSQSSSTATTAGTLRGQVTDPSGAVVSNAAVAIVVSGVQTQSTTTNRSGNYEIGNLAPGKY